MAGYAGPELIDALFSALPKPGSRWSSKNRHDWLQAMRAAMALLYDDDAREPESSDPAQDSSDCSITDAR